MTGPAGQPGPEVVATTTGGCSVVRPMPVTNGSPQDLQPTLGPDLEVTAADGSLTRVMLQRSGFQDWFHFALISQVPGTTRWRTTRVRCHARDLDADPHLGRVVAELLAGHGWAAAAVLDAVSQAADLSLPERLAAARAALSGT